jgi:hypothetical protein
VTSLLDEVMPQFDVRSRHTLEVEAPAEVVAGVAELYRVDRDASLATRFLILLRGLKLPHGTFREALTASGFALLAERPGEEVVLGTAGRFWALREQANLTAPRDLTSFREFDQPASAAGAVSLRIEPLPDRRTLLSTETRVRCTDPAGRKRFGLYWALIRIFSGWIRRDLLRGIGARAEALSRPAAAAMTS